MLFRSFNTPGTTSVSYRIIGPALGSGCVSTVPIAQPFGEVTHAQLDTGLSGNACLRADMSEPHVVTIRFPERVYGTYCQQLAFSLTSAQVQGTHQTTRSICVSVDKSPTMFTRIMGYLLAGLLMLVPVGLLLGLNYFGGQLPQRSRIQLHRRDLRLLRRNGGSIADDGNDLVSYNGFSGGEIGRAHV